jgi:hypothetical protein
MAILERKICLFLGLLTISLNQNTINAEYFQNYCQTILQFSDTIVAAMIFPMKKDQQLDQ